MKTSAAGRSFVCSFETCKLKGYLCPAGVPTRGFGHTGPEVVLGQVITQAQADADLEKDLERFERAVLHMVKVPLTQSQFDAVVSFAFNCGEGNLASSTLLRLLNAGDYAGAASQFVRWNRSKGVVLDGLTKRRLAERDIFLHAKYVNHR